MKVLGPILTYLFAWIDSIVAKMITLVYNLLMNLSNLVLYSDSIVKTLGQRIGIILGIFMLFRLAVSLINYMISPEKFSDNKTGGAQLVKNIIISLVLLATINTIFETAYMVQKRIVESGIVQKIFFGDNSETNPPSNEEGVDIGYYLYTGLFTPNEDVIPECKNMWDITTDLNEPIKKEEPDEYFEKSCDDVLFELTETNARNSIYEARNDLDMSKVFSNYDVVTANRDGAFTGTELFNYTPIVSTAVGVIALLILVSFSMELAIRAVKLLFLQIVAPVPIIANMDTGKGKDIFNKWLKQCINTYISVFIRLIAINFGVFMIVLVIGNFRDIFTGNILLNIFVIIGCLMFAKQVPKLIEDMFGIKLDGMTLHPLKNFEENALFGKRITGLAAGTAVGAIGSLTGAGRLQVFKGAFGGLASGKGFTDTWKNQVANNSKMRIARQNDSTFLGRRAAQLTNALGMPTPTDRDEERIREYDRQLEERDRQLELINRDLQPLKDEMSVISSLTDLQSEMDKRADAKILEGKSEYSAEVLEAQSKVETLKNSAGSLRQWVYDNGGNEDDYNRKLEELNKEISKAQAEFNAKLKEKRKQYITDNINGTLRDENGNLAEGGNGRDSVMSQKVDDYNYKIEANRQYDSINGRQTLGTGPNQISNYSDFDDQNIELNNTNQQIKHNSYGYETQKSNIEQDQRRIREQKKDLQTSQGYRQRQANKNAIGK